ncbi:MAG: metal-dependent hydrolase [Bacteroidales bacterium]|jgi:membrane-bound metal-dependent hydrolase YbcI (DUF457 family)|nr:metal-dependent hydrolase [Bacteroidales bacterium]
MDILTHIVTGAAVGTVIAAFRPKFNSVGHIILSGAVGGAFPDIDAISLWSKFDITIGKFLGLVHSGKEIYFGKFWYSHHGFFHSLVAAVIAGFLIGCFIYVYRRLMMRQEKSFPVFFKNHIPVFLAFILGAVAHAFEDMLTPASVWGGVRFLWPLDEYTGGWGKIWWWNNYDIFLVVFFSWLLGTWLIYSSRFARFRIYIIMAMIVLSCSGIYHQVNTRKTDYAYTGHTMNYARLEEKSKSEQQRILGKKIYRLMARFDNFLPFNF